MLACMRITKSKAILDLHPRTDGILFGKDPDSGDVFIHPNFNLSFMDNSSWHSHSITYIRLNSPKCDANLTAEYIKSRNDSELLERVRIVFKGFSDKYKKYWKDQTVPSTGESSTINEVKVGPITKAREMKMKQEAHRKRRKGVVSSFNCVCNFY